MPGVEHLLRDVKDASVSTLAAEVGTLAAGLRGLRTRLLQIQRYLELMLAGQLPVNHDIMYQLQARFGGLNCVECTQMLTGTTRAAWTASDGLHACACRIYSTFCQIWALKLCPGLSQSSPTT